MLTEPLIQQLHTLRLKGMASALELQRSSPISPIARSRIDWG